MSVAGFNNNCKISIHLRLWLFLNLFECVRESLWRWGPSLFCKSGITVRFWFTDSLQTFILGIFMILCLMKKHMQNKTLQKTVVKSAPIISLCLTLILLRNLILGAWLIERWHEGCIKCVYTDFIMQHRCKTKYFYTGSRDTVYHSHLISPNTERTRWAADSQSWRNGRILQQVSKLPLQKICVIRRRKIEM